MYPFELLWNLKTREPVLVTKMGSICLLVLQFLIILSFLNFITQPNANTQFPLPPHGKVCQDTLNLWCINYSNLVNYLYCVFIAYDKPLFLIKKNEKAL